MWQRVADAGESFDIAVIGGGATGLGIAVDAASRGYRTALFEKSDFAHGTSSRSTKLIHGGVRYLRQGDLSLVREALHERAQLLRNAPAVVHDLAFIVPCFKWYEKWFYGVGLKLYDQLAGRKNLGRSQWLSAADVADRMGTIAGDDLRAGVLYHDGQFDDARLAICLARTAAEFGAVVLNHAPVVRLTKSGEESNVHITGLIVQDALTDTEHEVRASIVINATGPFCDVVRGMDNANARRIIAPSRGSHVVLDGSFLPGQTALMVPKTPDGRVMFAIPWHGSTLIGTTDSPMKVVEEEPAATSQEIDLILDTAGRYLARKPTRTDIRSTFAGVRPLVRAEGVSRTASLSREHAIDISPSGLLTIAGGKWTTYRRMAEDAVNHAARVAMLAPRPCVTSDLSLVGGDHTVPDSLHRDPTDEQIEHAVHHEMAQTVEDFLSRRSRLLLLDATAAVAAAPRVAATMVAALGRDHAWRQQQVADFTSLAARYQV